MHPGIGVQKNNDRRAERPFPMANRSKFLMAATLAVVVTTTSGPVRADAMAQQILNENRVSEGAMLMDAAFGRPLLFAATVIGTGLFVVASPFTLAGGTTAQTWNSLVVTPASSTFARCLGCTPAQHERVRAERRTALLQQQQQQQTQN